MKYVLIGGSIACLGAILGIKSVDENAEITVFCGEKTPLYSRPLISYYLEGKTKEENLAFRGSDFYCKNSVDALSYKVTKINVSDKTVTAENGEVFPYDKLFVGTGSYPFVPPMQGLEKVKNKTCFYTLEDAKRLQSSLSPSAEILIVGAGLIGLKCAEGCYPTAKNITIVDMQTRVLPNATTPEVGKILADKLTEKGIVLKLGASVSSFEQNEATLTTGEKIRFDTVVLAIGVRPEVEPLASAGAKINRGIIVDEYMQTSLPDVYCAGDCAEGYDAVSGGKRLLQLFPSAYNGGYAAGRNMAGEKEPFLTDIALNSTSLFGLKFTSCGSYDGEKIETITENGYKALFIKDGFLVGYILVGDVNRAGIYTRLISHRVPLAEIDEKTMLDSPALIAYDAETRRKFLAEEA